MGIHQFHPTVAGGNAIGNNMLDLQKMLRELGHSSELFCEHAPAPNFTGKARHYTAYAPFSSPDNILLVHFSIGFSAALLDWLESLPDRKIIIYHNITPAHFFYGVNEGYEEAALNGREQFRRLRGLTDMAWGVSEYNCVELRANGWPDAQTLPIVFDPARYDTTPDSAILAHYCQRPLILFVSRLAPNKRFEDVITVFAHLKRHIEPEAVLVLVGSDQGMEKYRAYLDALIARLELPDVVFTGQISDAELLAYYQRARVYLMMSEHEGFGVPLLEAMHLGVPIVAYASSAVPETLGGTGILVREKEHAAIAELVGLLLADDAWAARIVARQQARLLDFSYARVKDRLTALLHSHLDSQG